MKEKPITFSPEMIRAILEGRKTQTRRIGKNLSGGYWDGPKWFHPEIVKNGQFEPGPKIFGIYGDDWHLKAPYAPGDLLYVREAYRLDAKWDFFSPSEVVEQTIDFPIYFEADQSACSPSVGRYRHARFMPKVFSRICLEVTDLRAEQLQDITWEDVRAEGFGNITELSVYWDKLHGPGSWDANPWVWVVKFKNFKP